MKQAKVIDGKKITTTDTGICFNKFKWVYSSRHEVLLLNWKLFRSKTIDFKQFEQYLDMLAKEKKIEPSEIKEKMINCGLPGTANTTQATNVGGVDRLTDTSKYTGAHKERFDESGKGKGIQGREDVSQNSGYVGNYKGGGTYDKTHPQWNFKIILKRNNFL